jgi:DNA-binding response OmpR family regulator
MNSNDKNLKSTDAEKIILVVDDDDNLRKLVGYQFKAKGYNVVSACNGAEALKRAQEIKPDLIILDIMMPKVDGAELAKSLKSEQNLKDVPIIFLTGLVSRDEDINIGGLPFKSLSKPFKIKDLLNEVRLLIG